MMPTTVTIMPTLISMRMLRITRMHLMIAIMMMMTNDSDYNNETGLLHSEGE